MVAGKRPPSDAELREAIHAIRLAWLQCKLISDRLLWSATSDVLDADTRNIVIADGLVNRDAS